MHLLVLLLLLPGVWSALESLNISFFNYKFGGSEKIKKKIKNNKTLSGKLTKTYADLPAIEMLSIIPKQTNF